MVVVRNVRVVRQAFAAIADGTTTMSHGRISHVSRHRRNYVSRGLFAAFAALSLTASGFAQEATNLFDCNDQCCRPGLRVPNMYGDILGNRPLPVSIATPGSQRQISGTLQAFNPNLVPGPALFVANLAPAPSSPTLNGLYVPPLTFLGQTITPVPSYTATAPIDNVLFTPAAALLENATTTADVQSLFALPGETAVFNAGTANQILRNQYNIFLVYDLVTPGSNIFVEMANPVDGGLVGRTKISTDNNPLPRDRFIFNYDYLNNTPLRFAGQDVHRFSLGFEKTFFDGRGSIELRAPFASTINPVADEAGLSGTSTEFGNLHLTLKALLFSNEHVAASTGVGISLPTADDTALRLAGQDVIRIENETTLLTPFVALLFTPNDRLFAQTWFQYGFDPQSNPVLFTNGAGGLVGVGRLTDPELMQIDFQLGYWLINNNDSSGSLRGLAPFIEVHYNKTTTGPDAVTAGPITVSDTLNNYNELNLSTGAVAQFGDNLHVTAGATFPLRNGNDRFGDYQLGLHVNWFFGGSSRANSPSIAY